MPQDYSELHYQQESTRHFLYSKAEVDDLPKKQIRTPASSIQAAVQSIYPALLTGHSFLEHSVQHLSSDNLCACGVIQIDTDGSSDFKPTKSEQTAAYQTAAKVIDELCTAHNGIW
ncbi:MAG: hypothetical protein P8X68_13810, partial [Desulfobacterales bacterium]